MAERAYLGCLGAPLQIEIITTAIMFTTQLGGWPYTGPAFQYAFDEIKNLYPCLNISHKLLYDDRYQACPEWATENVHVIAKYVLNKRRHIPDVTAFILPGCAADVLTMLSLITEWDMLLITSAANSPQIRDKVSYPTWITTSVNSPEVYLRAYNTLIDVFKWENFALVVNVAANSLYLSVASIVETEIKGHPGTQVHVIQIDTRKERHGSFEGLLRELDHFSRVYLLFGITSVSFRKFMLAASALNMTNGEHVYVTIIPFRNGLYDIDWKRNDTDDESARLAFRSVLLIELDESMYGEANGTYAHEFADLMIDRSKRQHNYTYLIGEFVSPHIISTYTALMIFAQVMNEVHADSKPIWNSGRSLAECFFNRTFETSISNATINEYGERMPVWVINQFDFDSGNLRKVMKFDPWGPNATLILPIQWPTEWPPNDEPYCGFRGDRSYCFLSENPTVIAWANAVAVVAVCSAAIVSWAIWRNMKTRHLKSKWWILNSGSLIWKGSGSICNLKERLCGQPGIYDETNVWIAPVFPNAIYVSSPLLVLEQNKKLLQILHDLRHLSIPNINRFYGICYTPRKQLFFVSAYCTRGSLYDLMSNMRCDKELQQSLIQDLLEGLFAVHRSTREIHGELSSHTCLIDNRFTLKLGNVAYEQLRVLISKSCDLAKPNKSAKSYSQKEPLHDPATDIYAVGIIMGHIILQKEVTLEDLREQMKTVTDPLMPTVEDCIVENPLDRPDITAVYSAFKKATGQKGNQNLMERIAHRLEHYSTELDALVTVRNLALIEERKKCDALLLEMLPRDTVLELRKGVATNPETFDSVTVMFSDIGGFADFVHDHTPTEIMTFLNDVYSVFDLVLPRFDAYKVETIKDSYMVTSGLPQRNGTDHAKELCLLAQVLINSYTTFTKASGTTLRVGMHSGSCVAGVVGHKAPRYCLFGDTVNTASRMLLYSEDSHIHLSSVTAELVENISMFVLVERGYVEVKGKGNVRTFWLQYDSLRNDELSP